MALVKTNRVKYPALLNSGSGSSYASEDQLDYLERNPARKEIKSIGNLTNLTTKKLKIYSVKIQDVNEKYALVIARFRVQYGQYFPSFSYFASEIKAKYEKRGKY